MPMSNDLVLGENVRVKDGHDSHCSNCGKRFELSPMTDIYRRGESVYMTCPNNKHFWFHCSRHSWGVVI